MFPNRLGAGALTILVLALSACVPDGAHKPVPGADGGGGGGMQTANAKDGVSYDSVKPIFAKVCAKCHPSRQERNWLDYGDAKAHMGVLMKRVVLKQGSPMPPAEDEAAKLVTEADRQLIGAWIKAGGPLHASASAAPSGEGANAGAGEANPGATAADVVPLGPNGKPVSAFVQQCFSCHGSTATNGPTGSEIPHLNGLSEDYIYDQLNAFQLRERVDPSERMYKILSQPMASTDQMHEAAAFYANLGRVVSDASVKTTQPERFARAKTLAQESCVQCHANPGPTDVTVPLISGQSETYLNNQLLYFKRARERTHAMMVEYTSTLSPDDLRDLAFYFSLTK